MKIRVRLREITDALAAGGCYGVNSSICYRDSFEYCFRPETQLIDCKANKMIVRAFWSAIAANDEDELRMVLAPDLQVFNPLESEPQNRDVHIQTLLQWNEAFSASRFEIKEQICEGNTVVTRGVMRAIHSKGPFLGLPATGIEVAVPGITFARIRDGRIVERHVCSDRFGMLKQLGLVP